MDLGTSIIVAVIVAGVVTQGILLIEDVIESADAKRTRVGTQPSLEARLGSESPDSEVSTSS